MRLGMVVALVVAVGCLGPSGHSGAAFAAGPLPPPLSAPGLQLGGFSAVAGAWYNVGIGERTPDQCSTPGLVGVCYQNTLAEAYSSSSATPATPTSILTYWIQLSLDASGVLHESSIGVWTSMLSGIAGPLAPGPTQTHGSSGMFAVAGSEPGYGTAHLTGVFTTSPIVAALGGDGVMQGGVVTVTITGTIFHQHLNGSTWVDDPNTPGAVSFQVVPSGTDSSGIACSSIQPGPCG